MAGAGGSVASSSQNLDACVHVAVASKVAANAAVVLAVASPWEKRA